MVEPKVATKEQKWPCQKVRLCRTHPRHEDDGPRFPTRLQSGHACICQAEQAGHGENLLVGQPAPAPLSQP